MSLPTLSALHFSNISVAAAFDFIIGKFVWKIHKLY